MTAAKTRMTVLLLALATACATAGGKGAKRDAVLLNAAAALVVVGRAKDLRDGVAQAAAALDAGRAAQLVERLRKESHA